MAAKISRSVKTACRKKENEMNKRELARQVDVADIPFYVSLSLSYSFMGKALLMTVMTVTSLNYNNLLQKKGVGDEPQL